MIGQAIREQIRTLEATSRRLEPPRGQRELIDDAVIDYGEHFVDRLEQLKAYEIEKSPARQLRDSPLGEEPAEIDELLALIETAIVLPGLNPASPGHLAYIPGGGVYASALGDYLAAVTNRYAGIRYTGPGAVEMENLLLDWMAELVGYPAGSGGNLASGGSIANLIGIVTARDARGLRGRDFHRAVVYLTSQAHHCIDKALRVAGLGETVQRKIPMDEGYRMIPAELDRAIREDEEAGLIPWLVIAAAGTTDVGAIDLLAEIGEIARRHGLWYHIDAAYGGFFALVDECRPQLAGMELSDSIVLDPHKGLFLPYGTGAVLVKDREALRRAHAYRAAYLQDAEAEERAGLSPAEASPELTKHFRGLRAWLPLKLHGLKPFRACLREKLLLTRYFHEQAERLGFQSGPDPELSVATYRWVPESGDANAFNAALIDEVNRDGRVFISSTMLDGVFWLRFAALTFRTHLDTVDLLIEILEEKVKRLSS